MYDNSYNLTDWHYCKVPERNNKYGLLWRFFSTTVSMLHEKETVKTEVSQTFTSHIPSSVFHFKLFSYLYNYTQVKLSNDDRLCYTVQS